MQRFLNNRPIQHKSDKIRKPNATTLAKYVDKTSNSFDFTHAIVM